jgi:site-specific recombinase XerD
VLIVLTHATDSIIVPSGPAHPRHELVAGAWLATYANPQTRSSYGRAIKFWFAWLEDLGVDPFVALRTHIEVYQREQEAGGFAKRTIAGRLTAIAMFYEFCVDEELLLRSPMVRVKRPKIERRSSTHWLTRTQFHDLVMAAKDHGPHQYALICLLGFNGLRIAEACSLDVGSLGGSEFYPALTFIRKGGKTGTAYLSRITEAAVRGAIGDREDGPLLLTRAGTRMNQKAAQMIIDRNMRHVDGAHGRITPHSLRHTFATLSARAGVPADQIQHDGGWADQRMLSYYTHGQDLADRAATHTVSAMVMSAA